MTDGDGKEVFSFPFGSGDVFSVRFIHSVNRTPVEEVYRIGYSGLELCEVWFEDFHAWVQDLEPGQKMEFVGNGGNKIKISGINRPVPDSLTYRVGQVVADHVLIFNGEEFPLSDFVKPGGAINFTLREVF